MLKACHKMRGWSREFQYLQAKIIGKIVKYQYLPAKTIHFSLSHLTLSSLPHIPLSPLFSWLWLHSQSLSVSLGRSLFEFILMHLARGLSSKLIIPPCVRPSVRPSPSSGKLKTYAFAPYCLKFQKIINVFYNNLAPVAFKHRIKLIFVVRQMFKTHHEMRCWNREFQYVPAKINR